MGGEGDVIVFHPGVALFARVAKVGGGGLKRAPIELGVFRAARGIEEPHDQRSAVVRGFQRAHNHGRGRHFEQGRFRRANALGTGGQERLREPDRQPRFLAGIQRRCGCKT